MDVQETSVFKNISDLTLDNIETNKLWDCVADAFSLPSAVFHNGVAHDDTQERQIILTAQVIHHSQQVQTFRIPFPIKAFTDLISSLSADDKINIAPVSDLVANVALKDIKRTLYSITNYLVFDATKRILYNDTQNNTKKAAAPFYEYLALDL